jgi:hypothetical protein
MADDPLRMVGEIGPLSGDEWTTLLVYLGAMTEAGLVDGAVAAKLRTIKEKLQDWFLDQAIEVYPHLFGLHEPPAGEQSG